MQGHQRLVDDHGLEFGDLRDVQRVLAEVAMARLLDVEDLVVELRVALADLLEHLDDVVGRLALLVGVGGETQAL